MSRTAAEERRRMLAENARRQGLGGDLYAPWSRSERLMVDGRRRLAAEMLHRAGVFPGETTPCLEIGFGDGVWLVDLLAFRVREPSLHGVEIDPARAAGVRRRLPTARLAVTGGARLPYRDDSFGLVIVSTVFTSILDRDLQERTAEEATRVLAPGGALLWYDFAVDNPRNPNVRGVPRRRLKTLFPTLDGEIRAVTLAPPILRRLAPWSPALVELLSALPGLRTHLLAVLKKPS